jgi:hypothetical protein
LVIQGEFTLFTKENEQIVFLLSHRHHDLNKPKPVPWDSVLAEPNPKEYDAIHRKKMNSGPKPVKKSA